MLYREKTENDTIFCLFHACVLYQRKMFCYNWSDTRVKRYFTPHIIGIH